MASQPSEEPVVPATAAPAPAATVSPAPATNGVTTADKPDQAETATEQNGEKEAEAEQAAPVPEGKLPTRKDMSLREFLTKMDDYAPIVCSRPSPSSLCVLPIVDPPPTDMPSLQIPDAVTNYYMTKAGLPPPPQTDPRLARLLALATQKFVADIAADAYQYSRIRASNTNANNPMGNLGAAAGFPIPGQPAGPTGAASKDQGRGGPLGIQRPGYGGGGQGGSQNRTVLTMEDLGMAVGEYGVNVKRSEFYR
ncbi:Transcription initiation factor TFIID subunit 10 [Verticillium dahliae]